jgi:hypothetical protein
VAYDTAGNFKVEDNNGTYYAYTVIPEFSSIMILPLFMLTALIATVLLKKKNFRNDPRGHRRVDSKGDRKR